MQQRVMRHTLYATFIISVTLCIFTIVSVGVAFAQETGRFERPDTNREVPEREDRENQDRGDRESRGEQDTMRDFLQRGLDSTRSVNERVCDRIAYTNERLGTEIPLPPFCENGEEPPSGTSHILISEVYYDVESGRGAETVNEWVELYNPADTPVDIGGWSIGDSALGRLLPGGTIVPAGGVILITNEEGLGEIWPEIPGNVTIVALGLSINAGGLSNTGDALFLRDPSAELVDSVSWGSNTDAFDPAVPDADEGESIERIDLEVDTDTAADWTVNPLPNPGFPGVLQQS